MENADTTPISFYQFFVFTSNDSFLYVSIHCVHSQYNTDQNTSSTSVLNMICLLNNCYTTLAVSLTLL